MKPLTHGSLFAGIGGFDLGFERAGIKTVWQVEIDPFCRKVLEKHWPSVTRYDDIRECCFCVSWGLTCNCERKYHIDYNVRGLEWPNFRRLDILSGGFPCQDISFAGTGIGIEGERSGLWREMFRIICELRPRFVVVENVAALLVRGIERVLGDLAKIGYDAEWDSLRAHDFGASHLRERVFIVAYPGLLDGKAGMAQERGRSDIARRTVQEKRSGNRFFLELGAETSAGLLSRFPREPTIRRMAHGIPNRTHRVSHLGNAVIPQIAEWIGKRIVEIERGSLGCESGNR